MVINSGGILSVGPGGVLNNTAINVTPNSLLLNSGSILSVDLSTGATNAGVIHTTGSMGPDVGATGVIVRIVENSLPVQTAQAATLITATDGGMLASDFSVPSGGGLLTQYVFTTSGSPQALDLVITVAPANAYAYPQNMNIANALTQMQGGSFSGSLLDLMWQMNNGNFVSAQSNPDAYNVQLSSIPPIVDGAVLAESFNLMSRTFRATNDRMDYLRLVTPAQNAGYAGGDCADQIKSAWIKLLGQSAHQGERKGVEGYHDTSWGIAIGLDRTFHNNQALLGLAFTWSTLNVHNDLAQGTLKADSYQGTLYGAYDFNSPLYLDGMVSLAYNNYWASRHETFGILNYYPRSDFNGLQLGAQVDAGYDIQTGPWHAIPIASLTYASLWLNSYEEIGLGTLAQTIDVQDFGMLLGGLGIELAYDYCPNKQYFVQPEIHFQVFYDFINDTMQTTSQFIGGGPSFNTTGARPAPWSFDLGASIVTFQDESGFSVALSYDYNFKSDYDANAGFIRAQYEW